MSTRVTRATGAHPRIRGEHLRAASCRRIPWGSSPHSRGTQAAAKALAVWDRLIPAFAGNTGPIAGFVVFGQAHPRIRGEHGRDLFGFGHAEGSSPHSRGTQRGRAEGHSTHGLIPAFAGNTFRGWQCEHVHGAHPRIRGEHWIIGFSLSRLIPAFAGNTLVPAPVPQARTAHPRIRGEHVAFPVGKFDEAGSSPHSRGTHSSSSPSTGGCGLIPAFAGNTKRSDAVLRMCGAHPRIRGEHGGTF